MTLKQHSDIFSEAVPPRLLVPQDADNKPD